MIPLLILVGVVAAIFGLIFVQELLEKQKQHYEQRLTFMRAKLIAVTQVRPRLLIADRAPAHRGSRQADR